MELTDGTRIATDLVISNLGLPLTVLRLLRDVEVEPTLRRRLGNIHYDRGQLFWANLAIHEPPRYAAELDNPGVGAQPRLYWGPKDLDYLGLRYQSEIYLQRIRRAGRTCSARSTVSGIRRARPRAATSSASRSSRRRDATSAPGDWREIKDDSASTCSGGGPHTRRT